MLISVARNYISLPNIIIRNSQCVLTLRTQQTEGQDLGPLHTHSIKT